MDGTQILALGLGLQAPWALTDQHLDTSVSPHRLDLYVEAERSINVPDPFSSPSAPTVSDRLC